MLYGKGIFINTCFDELNLTLSALIREVHDEYIRSGAEIIETNTFGANRFKLKKFGLDDKIKTINIAGARIAREAAGDDVFVAGSIGSLGVNLEPFSPVAVVDADAAFAEQASSLVEGGVDIIILETFSDFNEIRLALSAVRRAVPGIPSSPRCPSEKTGRRVSGWDPEIFTSELEKGGADVIGINCGVGPAAMLECVEKMVRLTTRPVSAMPNAGMPRQIEGRNLYLCSPEYMAEYAKRFLLAGVKIIGGCCGTTPAHIKAMRGGHPRSPAAATDGRVYSGTAKRVKRSGM